MRRTPIKFVNEEETTLKSMLQAGVIRPSTSSWASAPVLVRKKDGEVRYTVDYRKVNAKTIKDVYPLPLISECIDALEGTLWFHTLDLASGYWQIDIDSRDCHKTAFLTRHGLFEHVRLAQGLCNAPATFQRVMHLVLRGLTWDRALVYLDDVIVLGRSFTHSLQNLELVLQRFRAHQLKLKPKKCHLFCSEVEFLGRRITRQGVAVSDVHIKSVQDWPEPKNVEELQKFLGFINYHREFIPNLSKVASPLFALTRKDNDYNWDDTCATAFIKLKKIMTSPPLLSFPNGQDPFILDTDASDMAVGACLYQLREGKEYPVSYSSALLTPAQRRYCTTRKELLAIILFTRQYRHYLLGGPFVVRTDHHSLAWLCGFKDCSGQLGRWLEELSQYDLTIQHRPGSKHVNADAVSRIPPSTEPCKCYQAGKDPADLPCGGCKYCRRIHEQWERFEEDVDYVVPLGVRALIPDDSSTITTLYGYTNAELRKAQEEDPDLAVIRTWLRDGDPNQAELQIQGRAVKRLWRNRDRLSLIDGVLHYGWVNPDTSEHPKLLMPTSLRPELLYLAHDSKGGGHWGRDKSLSRINQSFIWPGMHRDVELYVKTCRTCNTSKAKNMPRHEMQTYQAGEPNERVHLDFLGPFETSNLGNKYILSIVDQFTRWIEIYPLPEQTAAATAKAFFDGWIARYGVPTIVHTDQGRNFTSQLFQDLCAYLECTKTRTTPYRPSSNGQVERYNRMILSFIRCFLAGEEKEWDIHLPILGMSLRSTINRTTGFTANMLMLGRELRMPWDIVFNSGAKSEKVHHQNVAEFVRNKLARVDEIFACTRQNIKTAQVVQKSEYDRRSQLRHQAFDVGDLVYTRNSGIPVGHSRKLQPILKGPYIVTKVISPTLFVIRDKRRSQVTHHDRLRLCEDRDIPAWARRARDTTPFLDDVMDDHLSGSDQEETSGEIGLSWLFQGTPSSSLPLGPRTAPINGAEALSPSAPGPVLDPDPDPTSSTAPDSVQEPAIPAAPELLPEMDVFAPSRGGRTRAGHATTTPHYLRDYVH